MAKRIFERKIYQQLVNWKSESDGNTALLIEGARRVGKSTIVEEFAKKEYSSYILIDFSRVGKQITSLFDDLSDLDYLFLQLQLRFSVELKKRKSLIIFDEVQLYPKARQAIKFLVADHRYDYIETGSLISIKKNVEKILIPSEEKRIQMNPMDFEEFLWANGDKFTFRMLKDVYESGKSLSDDTNRQMMRRFRLYMLVGGMPQAVNAYIDTNNLEKVDDIKRDILRLYEDDLKKLDSTGTLSMMLDAVPSQLSRGNTFYHARKVIGSKKTDDLTVLSLVSRLVDSKIVNIAYSVMDPDVNMAAYKSIDKFKLYMLDTGLFITLAFKNRSFTDNSIYEKLLNDKLPVNLGFVFENMVAQILTANGNELFYYTFFNEQSHRNYEIDFIFSKKNKICPIEVKSSAYKVHHSIDWFYEKYSSRILSRYIIHTKDISKDKDIICIPIYLTQLIL